MPTGTDKWDAENTYQVFDWLWSSGQLSERDVDNLAAMRIVNVINLALPTSSPALAGEAERVTSRGINYFQIPVLWEAPQRQQLELFFCLLNSVAGQPTWVHCAKNKRVSVFIYLYRKLCRHESDDRAAYPLREIWEPNPIWQAFIAEVLQAQASQAQSDSTPRHGHSMQTPDEQ